MVSKRMKLVLQAITSLFLVLGTVAIVEAAPATIAAQTVDYAATGAFGVWDFGGTDVTFKAATGEIWVVDAHSGSFPFAKVFRATNMGGGPRTVAITLPEAYPSAALLGIAEIPHGTFQGKNLILIDNTFGQDVAEPQVLLGLMDDLGQALTEPAFGPPVGLQAGARLSSIDVNPEREEIAAYDMTTNSVYILDFNYNVIQGPLPLLGFPCLFADIWVYGSTVMGGGVGLAYGGTDQVLVSSGFLNFGETRFVLEYDLASGGTYTGRVLDLSAAGQTGSKPDVAFVGMDTALAGADPVLAALNFGNDALFLFNLEYSESPYPVDLTGCTVLAETSQYTLDWSLPGSVAIDSIRIFENGAQVASLPPTDTTYTSGLPVFGKVFVAVATEKGGVVSDLRPICQLENTRRPQLDGVNTDAANATSMQRSAIYGVAVTKTPQTPADFRAYIVAYDSNAITVLNYKLELLEQLVLTPSVLSQNTNYAATGLALIRKDGALHLAVLDPDGPLDNNIPSGGLYALEGAERGKLVQGIPGFDLSEVGETPILLDWDALEEPDGDGIYQFVAGGVSTTTGDYILLRLEFDGTTMVGKEIVPMPQRLLSPFDDLPLTGVGVCFLPSGNILVAGSDTFSKTYTEALLLTPFNESEPDKSAKLVGYAQGLVVSNQFYADFGPGIGPNILYGLDAAYFPPAEGQTSGVGVTYLPTQRVVLIQSGQGDNLGFDPSLFVHSENACSSPDLKAEQLTETTFDIAAGLEAQTGPLGTSFRTGGTTDYFFYAINQSKTDAAGIELKVRLGGAAVDELDQNVVLPAGRYFRGTLGQRAESSIEVLVKNTGQAAASIKVIAGAMSVGSAEPQFRRSDCDGNGAVQITDAIFGLNWLFMGGTAPTCKDACDADDNGKTDITDMVTTLLYLFLSGPIAPAPGPLACGPDPSSDALEACVYPPASCN
jgi:hypothetical protein